MMADPVIYLIARVADAMALERAALHVADARAHARNGLAGAQRLDGATLSSPPPPPPDSDPLWLPPPLVEGNDLELREPVCTFGEELRRLVRRAEGFTYIEDEEKPGFFANASGAVLELDVGQTYHAVTFSHLRSWRPGMGLGILTCVDGCTCDEQKIDARHAFNVSVTVQHTFTVSAAPRCRLRIVTAELPPLPERAQAGVAPGAIFKAMGVTVIGLRAQAGALGGEMPHGTVHGISTFGSGV